MIPQPLQASGVPVVEPAVFGVANPAAAAVAAVAAVAALVEAVVDVHGADAARGTLPAALEAMHTYSLLQKCCLVAEHRSDASFWQPN